MENRNNMYFNYIPKIDEFATCNLGWIMQNFFYENLYFYVFL